MVETKVVIPEKARHTIDKAKAMPKGRYYIYESLKRELQNIDLTSEEYQTSCIALARILKV